MTGVPRDRGDLRLLRVTIRGHHRGPRGTLDYRFTNSDLPSFNLIWRLEMRNIVPASAQPILERTLDIVRIRANSNGECFGGEFMDALCVMLAPPLGVDRLDVLLTRTVLVRMMESLGETCPAEVFQN